MFRTMRLNQYQAAKRVVSDNQTWSITMTHRANIKMAALTALIALGAGAATAKSGDQTQAFSNIDSNADGQITQDEMKAHAAARFAKVDTDGDGFLTGAEMQAARAERGGKRAERMLKRFDKDGNGALDAAELEAAQKGRGGKRAGRMMSRMDANNDGKLSMAEMTAKRDPAKIFERLDTDGNGTLSAEEFAKGKRGHGKPASE